MDVIACFKLRTHRAFCWYRRACEAHEYSGPCTDGLCDLLVIFEFAFDNRDIAVFLDRLWQFGRVAGEYGELVTRLEGNLAEGDARRP